MASNVYVSTIPNSFSIAFKSPIGVHAQDIVKRSFY